VVTNLRTFPSGGTSCLGNVSISGEVSGQTRMLFPCENTCSGPRRSRCVNAEVVKMGMSAYPVRVYEVGGQHNESSQDSGSLEYANKEPDA
jgi:hypothetical protein